MLKLKNLRSFSKDQDGAVTVDWVVLTAGTVGLAILAVAGMRGSLLLLADRIAHFLDYHVH